MTGFGGMMPYPIPDVRRSPRDFDLEGDGRRDPGQEADGQSSPWRRPKRSPKGICCSRSCVWELRVVEPPLPSEGIGSDPVPDAGVDMVAGGVMQGL